MTNHGFTIATIEDVKKLALTRQEKDRYSNYYRSYKLFHAVAAVENPIADNLPVEFGIPTPQFRVNATVVSANDYHHYWQYNYNPNYTYAPKGNAAAQMKKLPMFVLVQYDGYQNHGSQIKMNEKLETLAKTAKNPTYLGEAGYDGYSANGELGSANVAVQLTHNGIDFVMVMPFNFAERVFGLEITDDMKLRLSNGEECEFTGIDDTLTALHAHRRSSYYDYIEKFDFTYDTLSAIEGKVGCGRKNLGKLLKALVKKGWTVDEPGKLIGIKKTWNRLVPVMNEVMGEHPLAFCSYRSFASECNRSVEGVKISAIFNDVFKDVETKEDFLKALREFYTGKDDGDLYHAKDKLESSIKKLDVYKEKRKAVLKGQANRAFAKIQQEAENLTIDKKKHKRTWAEIEAGNIALGTFFRKSEQYFLLNDNWDLWEEMIKRGFREQAIELANEVKSRTTYEKDLMSYFYFVLHGLPEFLKKHTGHKWTCIPKLVNTADELDPPKEEGGVARKRSALTPTVDNENHTVTVPYASLAIYGGFGTTYCYSHDYHVLTRGFSFNGYAVTKDLEEKLNGRDDYGLMFYTLTGSAQGRGYPTFLIIFERRQTKGDVRVHFHRTHPFRSKEGDYNPIHNWVKGCYNWMAGNIKRENIKAQQGDLFFVKVVETTAELKEVDGDLKIVKDLDFSHKVNQYDNHCFEEAVPFAEYTKATKSNILGYVKLEKDTWLRHTEHDDVEIPAGTYAIHQCRSWEANPKGVWSLRID